MEDRLIFRYQWWGVNDGVTQLLKPTGDWKCRAKASGGKQENPLAESRKGPRKRIGNRSNTGSQADIGTASNGDRGLLRSTLRGFGQVRDSNVASHAADTGSSGSCELWDAVKQLTVSPRKGDRRSNSPGAAEAAFYLSSCVVPGSKNPIFLLQVIVSHPSGWPLRWRAMLAGAAESGNRGRDPWESRKADWAHLLVRLGQLTSCAGGEAREAPKPNESSCDSVAWVG
jgi:hypothetical protein